ncbi:GNAT family N-acetyltransferase [Clostridium sp. C2-6-12]|uniref:GNAT family N-acetyltransferase n=1 Tax=Clostridium sp. C2-6-12 TaxID=2698832 RepID=UPI0013701A64|nr:GNAT family N-acetyltransferase [Clostridium sp. C2-6-12]
MEKIKNSSLKIRKAEPKDAEEIILMVKQVMKETGFFPHTAEEFNITVDNEIEYMKSTALFLLAEIDGKIVGSATLDRSDLKKLKHNVTFGITILKEYCGLGIGSILMEKIIEYTKAEGIEKIELEVFENNLSAIKLYRKFGFLEEGRRKKFIKTDEGYLDMIIMGRFIDN